MIGIRNIIPMAVATLLVGQGCQTTTPPVGLSEAVVRARLLGPTGHAYWDLVYSTDAAGRYQRADVQGRYPAACLRFGAPNQLLHYSNLDSVRVRDAGCHLDIVFNPGRFTVTGDTLTWFTDNKYVIKYLSEELLLLQHVNSTNPRAFDVYQKSAIQDKVVVACQ